MSGITGWVSYDSDLTNYREIVDAMVSTLPARGPDYVGTWVRKEVALGSGRLAIVDPVGGSQPMSVETPNGAITIVYSGETYNYIELRRHLQARKHRFSTDSDTEVVLHGYLEWGESVAEHLDGMYAFAIWDERNHKLVMVRDRLGNKPLYYHLTGDGLLFGSEPKAILANPLTRRLLDSEGLTELVALTCLSHTSPWKDMIEVQPGTVVRVDENGVHPHSYWTLPTTPHTDDLDTTIAKVRELVTRSVDSQLPDNVTISVLLSGGLDSSAIAALAAPRLAGGSDKLQTYSVDFPHYERTFKSDGHRFSPDTPYVRDVVRHIDSIHQDIVLDGLELADQTIRRAAIATRDFPAGYGDLDASRIRTFREVRAGSPVAFSGEVATIFSERAGPGVAEAVSKTNTVDLKKSLYYWFAQNRGAVLRPEIRARLDTHKYVTDQLSATTAKVVHLDGQDVVESRMREFCHLYIAGLLRAQLVRLDRLSAAAGLEVRTPLGNHQLVEYVYNIPWSLKTFDGREKSLLRHAVFDLLPPSVVWRTKSAYPTIQDPQYLAVLRQHAGELLLEPQHPVFEVLDPDWLRNIQNEESSDSETDLRVSLNFALDLYHWFDLYQPQVSLD